MASTAQSDCSRIPLTVLELESSINFVVSPVEGIGSPFRESESVTLKSEEKGEILPDEGDYKRIFFKQDLRKKIQERRRLEGLEPLKVDILEPVKYELSRDDKLEAERRKMRNRRSSERWHRVTTARYQCLLTECAEQEKEQEKLRNTVNRLKKRKRKYSEVLLYHQKKCGVNDDLVID